LEKLTDTPNIWEWAAQISQDNEYIMYNFDESGQYEIYVIPFPPTGQRWKSYQNITTYQINLRETNISQHYKISILHDLH